MNCLLESNQLHRSPLDIAFVWIVTCCKGCIHPGKEQCGKGTQDALLMKVVSILMPKCAILTPLCTVALSCFLSSIDNLTTSAEVMICLGAMNASVCRGCSYWDGHQGILVHPTQVPGCSARESLPWASAWGCFFVHSILSGPICTLMKAELRIHHKERYFSCIPDKHDVVINNHCKSWLKKRGRLEDPHVQSVERLCVRAQEWMKSKDLDIVF